jgi:ectoine hydroxylase-related dioxygenase (phytanoyl-CoA dioxygenase family)
MEGTNAQQPSAELLLERGYTVLRSFLDADMVAGLKRISQSMSEEAESILADAVANEVSVAVHAASRIEELIVVPESVDSSIVCRYEFMCGQNKEFKDFVTQNLLPLVSDFFGEQLTIFKDKTNEKHPGGGAFGPHQDFAAYKHFAPRYHITALISIDRSTIDNGCVRFAQNCRSVAKSLQEYVEADIQGRPLFRTVNGGVTHGDIVPDVVKQLEWSPIETDISDVVLFDSFVPHYSDINRSQHPRRAMFITMSRSKEGSHYDVYYQEKRNNYHDPKFHVSTPTWRIT